MISRLHSARGDAFFATEKVNVMTKKNPHVMVWESKNQTIEEPVKAALGDLYVSSKLYGDGSQSLNVEIQAQDAGLDATLDEAWRRLHGAGLSNSEDQFHGGLAQ